MSITYNDAAGVAAMRIACRLASEVLDYLTPFVKPGVTTNEIDRLAAEYMAAQGTTSATLGYQGASSVPYPKSLCTSLNHVVCHGIPNDKPLKKGDIMNIDVTGMIFTIEPMINAGRRDIKEDAKGGQYDGWTIVTRDHSLSAQWEHSVLVTETGYEVLTLSAGSPPPPAFVLEARARESATAGVAA